MPLSRFSTLKKRPRSKRSARKSAVVSQVPKEPVVEVLLTYWTGSRLVGEVGQ